MTPGPYDELLSLSDIAALTGKAQNTIRWYRANGTGMRTWLNGGRIVAWKSDVLEWLRTQELSSARGGQL